MDRGDLRRPIIRLRYWPTLCQLCRLDEAIAAISRSDRPKVASYRPVRTTELRDGQQLPQGSTHQPDSRWAVSGVGGERRNSCLPRKKFLTRPPLSVDKPAMTDVLFPPYWPVAESGEDLAHPIRGRRCSAS